jgi:hypothetical protein
LVKPAHLSVKRVAPDLQGRTARAPFPDSARVRGPRPTSLPSGSRAAPASWLEGPAAEESDAGHVTRAPRLFGAYRAWAQQHDPQGPLGYTAFIRAADGAAPIETRVMLMTERGRPQLTLHGIVLTAKRTGA